MAAHCQVRHHPLLDLPPMGMFKTFIFSIFFPFLFVLLTSHSSLAANPAKHIFILAGQSNMAGRGGVSGGIWDGRFPPEWRLSPSILRLSSGLEWESAREPLHGDIDVGKACGVGPGLAFANALLRANRSRVGAVGLVPCAVGGTKISQWAQGTKLYSNLVSRAKESMRDGGKLRAILWYQGESDTVRIEDAEAYQTYMERFIKNIRSDLNMPSLPVILVAIASGEGKFIETVRRAQLGIKMTNVKCVDAKGLSLKPDQLHLTTMSQLHLGLKLAAQLLASFGH